MAEQDLDTLCLLAGVFFPPVTPEPADSEQVAAYKQLDGQELRPALSAVRPVLPLLHAQINHDVHAPHPHCLHVQALQNCNTILPKHAAADVLRYNVRGQLALHGDGLSMMHTCMHVLINPHCHDELYENAWMMLDLGLLMQVSGGTAVSRVDYCFGWENSHEGKRVLPEALHRTVAARPGRDCRHVGALYQWASSQGEPVCFSSYQSMQKKIHSSLWWLPDLIRDSGIAFSLLLLAVGSFR